MFDYYPYFIAEVGVNHDGDTGKAKELIDAAKEVGCHAVKFQNWITDAVYSRTESLKPSYQKFGTDPSESEYETIKALELRTDQLVDLKEYCDEKEIQFLSTPDEWQSAELLLYDLSLPIIKIASQDVTNLPFLRLLAESGRPLILSTGAASLSEVSIAVEEIAKTSGSWCLMHCVSAYPAPLEEMNLRVITSYKEYFGCQVGFSDHSLGVVAAGAALALGAVVFEKHISMDSESFGPDHIASTTPSAFAEYVEQLKELAVGLGDGVKKIQQCETQNRSAFSRFIVASRHLPAGSIIQEKDLLYKKVQNGLEPKWAEMLIGKKLKRNLKYEERFALDQIDFSMTTG